MKGKRSKTITVQLTRLTGVKDLPTIKRGVTEGATEASHEVINNLTGTTAITEIVIPVLIVIRQIMQENRIRRNIFKNIGWLLVQGL